MTGKMVAEMTGGTLLREGPASIGAQVDTRLLSGGELFFALPGENRDGHSYLGQAASKGASGLVVARRRPSGTVLPDGPYIVEVESPLKALWQAAHTWRREFETPCVAVTGSFGKSSVKEMISAMLSSSTGGLVAARGSYNNAIGVPLTLLRLTGDSTHLVVELGTNHPGEIGALSALVSPEIGIITGIGPVHLEGLGSMEGVAREKSALVSALPAHGCAVLDREDPWFSFLAARASCRIVTVGIDDKEADIHPDEISACGTGWTVKIGGVAFSVPIPGRHAIKNFLLAYAALQPLGKGRTVIMDRIEFGMKSFKNISSRLEEKRLSSGVIVLDDSYNSNLSAAKAALSVLKDYDCKGRRVALLGEMLELGSYSIELHKELGRAAAKSGPDSLILFGLGPSVDACRKGAIGAGYKREGILRFSKIEDTVAHLKAWLKPGDLLLLKASRSIGLEKVLKGLSKEEGENAL